MSLKGGCVELTATFKGANLKNKTVNQSFYNFLEKTYEVGGNSPNRIIPMEGLRGFAVILVFFVHYHALFAGQLAAGSLTFKVSKFLEANGNSGVDLFFVLSGYLIYGAVIKKFDFGKFLYRRAERIYPTFLVVFVIYLTVSFLSPENSKIPADTAKAVIYILENLFLLPGIFDITPLITVAWSLSYEFFYYLVLPVVVLAFGLRKSAPSRRVLFFVGLTAVCIIYSFINTLPNLKLLMFISGILVYESVKSFELHKKINPAIEYMVLAVLMISFMLVNLLINFPETLHLVDSRQFYNVSHLLILFIAFFLLVLACVGSTSILKSIFSWLPLRWLGNMSYSYYLIHGFTLHLCALVMMKLSPALFESAAVFWFFMPVFFAVTWLSSTLLFMFVEKPFSLGSMFKSEPKTLVFRESAQKL